MAVTGFTSAKNRVYRYLKSQRKYVPGPELVPIGGTEALRRVRELRSEGVNVLTRRNTVTGVWEYKIAR
jgi:hypothetical protein